MAQPPKGMTFPRIETDPTEWATARSLTVLVAHVEDSFGTTSDGPALVLDNGEHHYVIEGTRDEVRDLLRSALALVDDGGAW